MPFSRWEHIIFPNCYHSICPYVLVSGVVGFYQHFPPRWARCPALSVKVVAHLSDVTASSPQSVTYGWHIRISFVFLIGMAQRNTEIKASGREDNTRSCSNVLFPKQAGFLFPYFPIYDSILLEMVFLKASNYRIEPFRFLPFEKLFENEYKKSVLFVGASG